MTISIRAKIDSELTSRIGKWFTVREIQDKLRVSPSTLKPLIMRYARENVLRRRHVKGTARSVQFSPAASNPKAFHSILVDLMPYRGPRMAAAAKKKTVAKKTVKRSSTKSKSKAKRK